MRIPLFLFMMCLLPGFARAQFLKGTVCDSASLQPLHLVTITDLATNQSTITDELGRFSLPASKGDMIAFSFIGYNTIRRLADPLYMMQVRLSTQNVQLQEYVLHTYTPFQEDSIEMTTRYSKELNKTAIKPQFTAANGGGMSGLIGGVVQKMSKSYKQNKRFKENFKSDMEQKFIDTRYTPQLVNTLTRFTGDTLAIFMNTYPMDYSFARSASDLELKMWIRNNYKEYLKSGTVGIPSEMKKD